MDEEAQTTHEGYKTGLHYYGGHYQPDESRPDTEPSWTNRLAEMLPKHGWSCEVEQQYPEAPDGQSSRCDLVIEVDDGSRLWLEVKGAWKDYWLEKGGHVIYRSYLLHPLIDGLMEKSHTAANDLRKLEQLDSDHATHVGLLLVGFDRPDAPMEEDIDELKQLTDLGSGGWHEYHESWPDPHHHARKVKCWLWVKENDAASSSRAHAESAAER